MNRGRDDVRFPFLNSFSKILSLSGMTVSKNAWYTKQKRSFRNFFSTPHKSAESSWLERLTGSVSSFSMENKIFNGVSIVSLAGLFLFTLFNIMMELPVPALIMGVVMLVQVWLYYLSRFKKKPGISAVIFGIIGQICLGANFYYNSGLHGPTLFGFFLTFQLVISVTPKKQHLYWLLIHILVVSSLLIFQYARPDLIYYSYATRKDQYLDMLFTYVAILASIFWITGYLKYSYENQRHLIESQNEKLEKLNAEKNKIFSIVAHDLRSPLATIQGYLEMIMYFPEEGYNANHHARLLDLTKGTSDMLANLLLWSKSQMEGEPICIREVNLYQLVASVLAVQDNLARGKQITIHSVIDPEYMVLADREMLSLVIRNLINNAIKFSPQGSTIKVESSLKKGVVYCSITDEGVGITPVQQEQLFSLKTTSSYGTNNEKGTGLGLVLCKEFMERMNGVIWYEKGTTGGSVFTISIPVANTEIPETNVAVSITKKSFV